jgi:hypothetical protein
MKDRNVKQFMLRGGHQQEGKVNEEIKQSEYG